MNILCTYLRNTDQKHMDIQKVRFPFKEQVSVDKFFIYGELQCPVQEEELLDMITYLYDYFIDNYFLKDFYH